MPGHILREGLRAEVRKSIEASREWIATQHTACEVIDHIRFNIEIDGSSPGYVMVRNILDEAFPDKEWQ